jgi:Zn-dependent protease with chaperone function
LRAFPIARACSIEIRVHQAIFLLVFLPLLGLFFPAVFTALSLYAAANAIASLPGLGRSIEDAASAYWLALVILSGAGLVATAVFTARQALRREFEADRPPEGRKPPRGTKGEILTQRLASIWTRLPTRSRPPPSVVWYSNFNVLAHAYDAAGGQTIEVSSGLWERVTREDPVALGILAHETAHLVFRDPPMFRAIAVATAILRQLLRIVLGIAIAATAIVILSQMVADIASRAPAATLLDHACAIAAVAALVLIALPFSTMIVRRYSGFIVSLMEVRADVTAALWTSGLMSFATALANDPTLRRSTLTDLRHSLVSLDLTHISETERLNLLKSTDRLITPKARYFALSLALPLLVPINAATYLIEGGAFDHALVTAVVVAFQLAATSMVLIGSETATLSWRRALYLGLALCLVQSLPLIDLAPIGYLFTNYAIAIAMPGGLGSDPMTLPQILSDLGKTVMDVAGKIANAVGGACFPIAAIVAGLSLRATALLARRPFAGWLAPAVAATIVSLLSSFDTWRDPALTAWPVSVAEAWSYWTLDASWLWLCAPSVAALGTLVLTLGVRAIAGMPQRSGRLRKAMPAATAPPASTP